MNDSDIPKKRSRGRPPAHDIEKTLDAVISVFWEKGYALAGYNDFEAATNLKRASLYAAFGDKATMYEAALDRYLQNYLGRAVQILNENASPIKRLHDLADFWENFMLSMRGRGCFATQIAVTQPDAETLSARKKADRALEQLHCALILVFSDPNESSSTANAASNADVTIGFVMGLHQLARTGLQDTVVSNFANAFRNWANTKCLK